MKKLNNLGFTLIELLAVITIMGILMMVAIPSVTRTIENSRRDTFATMAHEYLNAVRNGVLADNIECGSPATVASATPDGWYYFTINTTAQGTKDLMESGGKSPFGNAEINGYVLWHKKTKNANSDNQTTTTTYYMKLVDTGKHGFDANWLREDAIKRANISTATTGNTIAVPAANLEVVPADGDTAAITTGAAAPRECKLS